MKKQILTVAALSAFFVTQVPNAAMADVFLDGTTTAGAYVDRYAPNSFVSGTVAGSPALISTISSVDSLNNRSAPYNSTFYNTQGVKYDVNVTPGTAWSVSGDLYVSSSMLSGTGGPLTAELWTGTGNNNGYYIFSFLSGLDSRSYSANASASSRLGIFDDTTGLWSYFSSAGLTADAWNTISIQYDNAGTVSFWANGSLITSQGPSITGADTDVANLSQIFLENYNAFGNGNVAESGEYSTAWKNISAVPEPSSFALAGLGLAAFVIFRRSKLAAQS